MAQSGFIVIYNIDSSNVATGKLVILSEDAQWGSSRVCP